MTATTAQKLVRMGQRNTGTQMPPIRCSVFIAVFSGSTRIAPGTRMSREGGDHSSANFGFEWKSRLYDRNPTAWVRMDMTELGPYSGRLLLSAKARSGLCVLQSAPLHRVAMHHGSRLLGYDEVE
jgi:hypothetical protein